MGVANPTGLIIIFLFLVVVLTFAQIAYRQLKQYRGRGRSGLALAGLSGRLLAASLIWFTRSGDSAPTKIAWWFFKTAAVGLVGSFALHESAHVMVLKRIDTVTHLAIDRTRWRISVVPLGTLTARQVVGVAIAGPLSCVVVGSALWISRPSLAWWYLAHGIFLLPFFGDGRSLIAGLRGRGA
jgi:hypothetical protein